MLALDPTARPSFVDILDMARDVSFPDSFYSFLHTYITSINETSSPSLFARSSAQHKAGAGAVGNAGIGNGTGRESWATIPSDSDHRIERIWGEFDSIEPILMAEDRVEDTVTQLPPPPPPLLGGPHAKTGLTSRPFQVRGSTPA